MTLAFKTNNRHCARLFAALTAALVPLASSLASSSAWAKPQIDPGVGLPPDVSVHGHRIEWLMNYAVVAGFVAFGVMCVWLFYACFVYTEASGRRATYTHGDSKRVKIGGLAIAALLFFAVDGVLFYNSTVDMKGLFLNFDIPLANPDVVRIEINAHQWAWDARYPGPDGKFNTQDDVVTLNDIRVPVGTPVVFQIASVDVIHAFYLPNFRYKVDAMPGMINGMWIEGNKIGEYEIGCAQHCGTHHYKMKGRLTVMKKDAYQAWLARSSSIASIGYDKNDVEAHWGWPWQEMSGKGKPEEEPSTSAVDSKEPTKHAAKGRK